MSVEDNLDFGLQAKPTETFPPLPPHEGGDELPSVVSVSKPPHPGFWWALLWCVVYLVVTQVGALILALIAGVAYVLLQPDPLGLLRDIGSLQAKPRQSGPVTPQQRKLTAICAGTSVPLPAGAPLGPSVQAATTARIVYMNVDTDSESQSTPLPNSQADRAMDIIIGFLLLGLLLCSWGLALLVVRLVVGREWTRRLALRRPSVAHCFLAIVALPCLLLCVESLDHLLKPLLPKLADLEFLVERVGRFPLAVGLALIALSPAVAEELWFRGFLGRGLVGRYGVVVGVLITSVLFGLIHIEPRQVLYAPILGIWFHFVYLTTRSLWVPMLLHFLTNGTSVLMAWLIDRGYMQANLPVPSPRYLPVLFVTAGVVLVSVGWSLYQSRVRFVLQNDEIDIPWQPDFPGVEYPPHALGAITVRPLPSLAAIGAVCVGVAQFCLAVYLAFFH